MIKARSGKRRQCGFTMVEIMIVVCVVGILAMLAIPNLLRAKWNSVESKCLNNLRLIWAAKDQYAFENAVGDDMEPTEEDLRHYMRGGEFPTCPYDGDHYTIRAIKHFPKCANDQESNCMGHRIAAPSEPPEE